ncbi:MAG: hypothetical protein HZB51_29805 [Chloroflexi bacterium]|nr:hypothetical protein [Chloroflexota bacterium]
MVQVELNPDQATMLQKILESYLSDLRVEIAGTDLKEFREALKEEERFIKEFLRRLENIPVPH